MINPMSSTHNERIKYDLIKILRSTLDKSYLINLHDMLTFNKRFVLSYNLPNDPKISPHQVSIFTVIR